MTGVLKAQDGTSLDVDVYIEWDGHSLSAIELYVGETNTDDYSDYKYMFQVVPEYPEFAWLEGVVNAVTHRNYGYSGDYIRVLIFDDRMEIQSPGKLPNLVTLEHLRHTRWSRNPVIAQQRAAERGDDRQLRQGGP